MRLLCIRVWLAAMVGLVIANPGAKGAIIFVDDFDLDSRNQYNVNADVDTQVDFAYDYAADGIPMAPNTTTGTSFGLKFQANMTGGVARALSISPIGGTFSGDFVVKFDMWINVNGPLPGGGTGSTQFVTAGVGTTGFNVQKNSGSADGVWFAVDGEGGSGVDFRAYQGPTLNTTNSNYFAPPAGAETPRDADNPYYHTAFPGGQQPPFVQQLLYPSQTGSLKPGTVGFEWREFEISKIGNEVKWTLDGLEIARLTDPVFGGENIFVGYWDPFNSLSDNPAMSFGLLDNLRVEAIPEPSSAVLVLAGFGGCMLRRRRKLHGHF